MRVETYDPSLGCVAMPLGRKWMVVNPAGEVITVTRQEQDARAIAQHRNVTATPQERQLWRDGAKLIGR